MTELFEALAQPFGYAFFVKGIAVATVSGALLGLLGVFIVLRGMSYLGHGLSHAIFGGFAASQLVAASWYLLGAGVWGVASALAITSVARRRRIGSDAAIGVVTTASFALGVALLARFGNHGPSFEAALFGSILGITPEQVWLLLAVSVLSLALVVLRYRALLFVSFDPEVAAASGVNVARTDAALMCVLSMAILATLTVIGVTLVAAMLVIPAATARLLTSRFSQMLLLSSFLGAGSGLLGMYASYFADVPSGTMIVLVCATFFGLALAFGSRVTDQIARTPASPGQGSPDAAHPVLGGPLVGGGLPQ